jgi:MFS transporter, UMF1 family
MLQKNNPKVINAWCMYDWANSVHNLVITTAIFPIYFRAITANPSTNDHVDFMGFSVNNASLYSFTVSAAQFFLVLINPISTALADYSGRRKFFMKFFCYLGALSCAYFYFSDKSSITSTIFAFGFSIIGWGGSVIYYNSFLPDIATEDRFDSISARGFAFGYVGSVLLLIFNLMMVQKPEWFGIPNTTVGTQISFLTVGIWWALFAQIPFAILPKDNAKPITKEILAMGFIEIKRVMGKIRKQALLMKFLGAYFVYYMGVMTVIYVATIFADKELKIPTSGLITTLLLIQLVGIPGSYLASWFSKKFGNTIALRIEIFIWALVPIAAYFTTKAEEFYVIAAIVGMVMGGVQSLSRSTYAKLIPEDTEDTAKYFGLYDILEKLATSIGSLMFGLIAQITGSMRDSLLFLIVTFVIGFLLLMRIPSKKVYHEQIKQP